MIRPTRRALLLSALAAPALAQDFPSRPLRLVVPFPPGGGTDILARVMAQRLGEWMGQSMVVENRGGAGGAIGTQAVARARPDGHTLLFTSSPPIVVLPAMQPPPPYDAERDLQPIATLAQQAILFVVPAASPHRDLGALLRAASGGRSLSYGTPGVGTDPHLAAEVLAQAGGASFTHVPYRGGGPAIAALLAGETDFNPALTGVAKPLLAEGRVRALAITAPARSADFPDVPTTAELGMPQVDLVPWWGLFAPAGLEAPVARRLGEEARRLAGDGDWLGRLQAQAIEPAFLDGAATAAAIGTQLAGWRQRLPGMRLQ